MVRCAKWMSSLAVGMVLSLEGIPAHAQQSSQGEPTPALLRPIGGEDHPRSERTADFVAVIPNGEDVDQYEGAQPADAPGPVDAESMDDSRPSDTEVPRRNNGADATDSDDAETEVINQRYPNGSLKIEREVTQDVQGNYLNHGLWKMWDPNGNIISQGEHWYGSRTGTWIRWYRNPAEAGLLSKAPISSIPDPMFPRQPSKMARSTVPGKSSMPRHGKSADGSLATVNATALRPGGTATATKCARWHTAIAHSTDSFWNGEPMEAWS